MKQILLVTACVCAVASGSALAQSKYPASKSRSDAATQGSRMDNRSFVLSAAQGAFADVELGKLALERASSAEVKRYAQQMVDAGEKKSADLKPLLKTQEIPPQVAIDARHKVTRDWLAKLSGESFDRGYVAAMSAKQGKDASFFQRAAELTNDPGVKAWASQALPIAQEHLAAAKAISLGSK
jgi:putative membrane protein